MDKNAHMTWSDEEHGAVIAERMYQIAGTPDGIHVRIGEPMNKEGDCACAVHIRGIDDDSVRMIFGVDALQALCLAIDYVSVRMHVANAQLAGDIEWLGERQLGLPPPASFRSFGEL